MKKNTNKELVYKAGLLILLLSLMSSVVINGQSKKDFAYYDQLTFQLYEQQKWNQLIETGKEAKRAGFDYHSLNMRMGIACFEKQQYFNAINYFKDALLQNKKDLIAPEYLYHSYQFTNQQLQASGILKKYPAIQARVSDKPQKIFSGLFLEGTYKFHELNHVSNLGLFNLGLRHQPFPWMSITHSYNRLSFDQIALVPAMGTQLREQRNLVLQKGYYARADLNLAGFIFSPAINIQQVNTATMAYPEKVYYLGIGRQVGNFYGYISHSQSRINLYRQKQWSASLTWYPLSNLNLYLRNQIIWHSQESFKNTIALHEIGFNLTQNVWLEMFYQYGNIYNFNTDQAYLLFNFWDNINSRSAFNMLVLISANVDLNLSLIIERHNEFNKDAKYNFTVVNSSVNFKF